MFEQRLIRSVRTYIQQLCTNAVCSPEDLPEAMDDTEDVLDKKKIYKCLFNFNDTARISVFYC